MKHPMRKIAVVLLAIMLFSALTGYTYAANTTFQDMDATCQAATYMIGDDPDRKWNSSDMVVFFDPSSIGSNHYVRAMGCGTSALGAENCTIRNGVRVDHVVCSENTYYSVTNTINENGYRYAYPSIAHDGGYGTVTGEWAPDSAKSYASPSAP